MVDFSRLHFLDSKTLKRNDEFDESKHPRAANGRFGSGGGSSSTKSENSEKKSESKSSSASSSESKSSQSKGEVGKKAEKLISELKSGELTPRKEASYKERTLPNAIEKQFNAGKLTAQEAYDILNENGASPYAEGTYDSPFNRRISQIRHDEDFNGDQAISNAGKSSREEYNKVADEAHSGVQTAIDIHSLQNYIGREDISDAKRDKAKQELVDTIKNAKSKLSELKSLNKSIPDSIQNHGDELNNGSSILRDYRNRAENDTGKAIKWLENALKDS